jgi:hypothetical protein
MDMRGLYEIKVSKIVIKPSGCVGRNRHGQAESFRDDGQDGQLTVTLDVTCLRECDQIDSIRAIEAALTAIGFMPR